MTLALVTFAFASATLDVNGKLSCPARWASWPWSQRIIM